MKVLLLIFSGTNNTYEIARLLASDFSKRGHVSEIIRIDADTPVIDLADYDLIGFGYPIYAFNEPRFFLRYFRQLKLPADKKYFVFKTSGETLKLNNASSRRILRRLRHHGCRVLGDYHFVMPYNIHFRFEDAFVKEILTYDRKLSRVAVYDILSERPRFLKTNLFYDALAWMIGIQRPGATINSFLYRVDEDKCSRCGKCVRECPTHNIVLKDGKIIFGHRCEMCMRCSFFCPRDGIRIGFLNRWKVNGPYDFERIADDESLATPYITEKARGFYRCFIAYFRDVDAMYRDYLDENAKQK